MSEKKLITDHITRGFPFLESGSIIRMRFESGTKIFILHISRELFAYMYKNMKIVPAEISEPDEEEIPGGMVS